ncbi:TIGR03668 family PPOX class F420-dependent oxidoreductase [Streptomyces violaceus]|uniref:TIGR03668 family PPOX class F420-dependent oxidoreductase n=2 Tax=Streptomyces violaceus TaxID=1936 RepID=A0ABY9UMJ6_STRVL|nr:TIGR03668 family PPOX class F420-dependent oxidoreductase [Streptomyces janthinus]WND24080.1 TIGR03668 family PPOX class F420-dependent oxidoreductase [Streptomyces janthinus]
MGMTDDELRERFTRAPVLRLGTADRSGKPHLVPATFAVAGDVVAIAVDHKPKQHTNLKRLRNIQENPAVSLLVDHFDADWDRLWWVRADGQARVLENELAQALVDELVDKYEQYKQHRPAGPVIEIRVNRWSGWAGKSE